MSKTLEESQLCGGPTQRLSVGLFFIIHAVRSGSLTVHTNRTNVAEATSRRSSCLYCAQPLYEHSWLISQESFLRWFLLIICCVGVTKRWELMVKGLKCPLSRFELPPVVTLSLQPLCPFPLTLYDHAPFHWSSHFFHWLELSCDSVAQSIHFPGWE